MNKSLYAILPAVMTFSFLSGCMSTAGKSKKLDNDLAQTSPIESRQELNQESKKLIESSDELSPDEKTQLLEIRKSARTQLDALRENELKLQSVLIKEVLSKTKYDDREVDNIKARMDKAEKQRLAILFDTVDRANKVLGRASVRDKEMMLNDVMDFHYPIHEL